MFISPAPNVTLSHKWVLDQILNDSTALSKGLPWWLSDESICLKCRRPGFDPWVGKIPWKREQYSGLENSLDCIVRGVAKSRT